MNKSRNFIITLIIVAAIIAIVGIIFAVSGSQSDVPQEFQESRIEAAKAAKALNDIINKSIENLSIIARYEREGAISDALELTSAEIENSTAREHRAATLATEMEIMARAIPGIGSRAARQKAIEAVSAQVAAVSLVIPYNSAMNELMSSLEAKFRGQTVSEEELTQIISELNFNADQINVLNKKFVESLETFDAILDLE